MSSGVYLPEWDGLINGAVCGAEFNKFALLAKACKEKVVGLYITRAITNDDGTKYSKQEF